jgi:hypothetical protein
MLEFASLKLTHGLSVLVQDDEMQVRGRLRETMLKDQRMRDGLDFRVRRDVGS